MKGGDQAEQPYRLREDQSVSEQRTEKREGEPKKNNTSQFAFKPQQQFRKQLGGQKSRSERELPAGS